MKEADGSELGARRRCRAGVPERSSNRAQEDLEHGTGDPHIVVEVGTQALWHGKNPWGYPDSVDRVSSAVRSVCFFSFSPGESEASAALQWSRSRPIQGAWRIG